MCLLPLGGGNSIFSGDNNEFDWDLTEQGSTTKWMIYIALIFNLVFMFIGLTSSFLLVIFMTCILCQKNSCCGLYLLVLAWFNTFTMILVALNLVMDQFCKRGEDPTQCFLYSTTNPELNEPTLNLVYIMIGYIIVLIYTGESGQRAQKEIEAQNLTRNLTNGGGGGGSGGLGFLSTLGGMNQGGNDDNQGGGMGGGFGGGGGGSGQGGGPQGGDGRGTNQQMPNAGNARQNGAGARDQPNRRTGGGPVTINDLGGESNPQQQQQGGGGGMFGGMFGGGGMSDNNNSTGVNQLPNNQPNRNTNTNTNTNASNSTRVGGSVSMAEARRQQLEKMRNERN